MTLSNCTSQSGASASSDRTHGRQISGTRATCDPDPRQVDLLAEALA
jgi:hypothetical protein